MHLSELTDYAKEKYGIGEQHKWESAPDFSVLTDPYTGEWTALLMRRRVNGTVSELCDLKCGRDILSAAHEPYLTAPFRMQGSKWIGVVFDENTSPDVVFRPFDRAVSSGEQRGYTVVVEDSAPSAGYYSDTVIPPRGVRQADREVPAEIQRMRELYDTGNFSYAAKCRNFYIQGKFMEDYTDDTDRSCSFRRSSPVYQEMTDDQLRTYFTWRTRVRKGEFPETDSSYVELYISELLSGIGTSSHDDVLDRLEALYNGYYVNGPGGRFSGSAIPGYMFEYAVIYGLERAVDHLDTFRRKKDEAFSVLLAPEDFSDEQVFKVLCESCSVNIGASPVMDAPDAVSLFADCWRKASERCRKDGKDLIDRCVGEQMTVQWYPLQGILYYRHEDEETKLFRLNSSHVFVREDDTWYESYYVRTQSRRDALNGFMHEADRQLRKYLKTGRSLKMREDEQWAAPYIAEVTEEHRRAAEKAKRPKITIDISALDRIRSEAAVTRESLLTDEEREADIHTEDRVSVPTAEVPAGSGDDTGRKPLIPLTDEQIMILAAVTEGRSVKGIIAERHLMAELVTDTLNELLSEEIGDIPLECTDGDIRAVEDYLEDIIRIIG